MIIFYLFFRTQSTQVPLIVQGPPCAIAVLFDKVYSFKIMLMLWNIPFLLLLVITQMLVHGHLTPQVESKLQGLIHFFKDNQIDKSTFGIKSQLKPKAWTKSITCPNSGIKVNLIKTAKIFDLNKTHDTCDVLLDIDVEEKHHGYYMKSQLHRSYLKTYNLVLTNSEDLVQYNTRKMLDDATTLVHFDPLTFDEMPINTWLKWKKHTLSVVFPPEHQIEKEGELARLLR